MVISGISFFLGKTSLADTLVASNGIISPRQAGKVLFKVFVAGYNSYTCCVIFSYDTWIAERMNSFVELQ